MSAPTSLFAGLKALDAKSRFFFVACTTICVSSVLHMLPLPLLSRRLVPVYFLSYRLALLCGLLAHGYRVFYSTTLPKPPTAESLKKLTVDLAQSNSFLSCVYCFIFLIGGEVNMVLLPIGITALYQAMTIAAKFASSHPLWASRGQRAFDYLQANMEKALAVCFMSEVMTGFFLIAQLFTAARQVPRAFVYWNLFLRARYACRDNTVYRIKFTQGSVGEYHRLVWDQVGGYADKVVARVPALAGPKQAAIKWFRGY